MSSIGFNSAKHEAVASQEHIAIPATRRRAPAFSLQQATVLTIGVMIVMGLGLRLVGLGWGTPVYFYLLFLAIKVPLAVLCASVAGFFVSLRRWRSPGPGFVLFGLSEAIRFVAARGPRQALIVSETPGVVGYYLEKFGRTDLQSRVLSDPQFTLSDREPAYFILQQGRTYFENQTKMKEVRDRFRLVYAGCIEGHTAAEVYATQAAVNDVVMPCGDARP